MYRLEKGNILTESILMEATRDEIYAQYYDENNGKVKRIPKYVFDGICETGDIDDNPNKMSEFAKWLCDMWNTPKWERVAAIPRREFQKCFKIFRKLQKIKPKGVDLNLKNYDATTFILTMNDASLRGLDLSQNDIKKLGSQTLYKDDKWYVLWLKTYEASMFYGRGTKWCTASSDSRYYFDSYSKSGMLVCFIHLKTGGKWQSHVDFSGKIDETRNAEDYEDNIYDFVNENIVDTVLENCRDIINSILEEKWSDYTASYDINDNYRVVYNKDVKQYRIQNKTSNDFISIFEVKNFSYIEMMRERSFFIIECIGGEQYMMCEFDNIFINPKIDDITTWYHPYLAYGEIYVFRRKNNMVSFYDPKKNIFLRIGGNIVFKDFDISYDLLSVLTLNGSYKAINYRTDEIIRINGEENFELAFCLTRGVLLIKCNGVEYLYSNTKGIIGENVKRTAKLCNNIICIYFDSDIIPDMEYFKLYNSKTDGFMNYKGYEKFIDNEKITNYLHLMYVYYDNEEHLDEKDSVVLFNGALNKFCLSYEAPNSLDDIVTYNDKLLLFWNEEDELMYYRITDNTINKMPVTIKKNDINEAPPAPTSIMKYNIDDNTVAVIYLMDVTYDDTNLMLIVQNKGTEEEKITQYRLQ